MSGPELFADRIGEIRFANGVFRIDLVSFDLDPEQPVVSQLSSAP